MTILLSPHFSLEEATHSNTAQRRYINNTPPPSVINTMKVTANKMEKVREILHDWPIIINSWYRCPELNRAIGSKSTSQHLSGEAIDFVCPIQGTPAQVAKILAANKHELEIDQLILEHSWIHISFAILTGKPRGQVLSLLSNKLYAVGLTDRDGKPIT